MKKLAYIFLFMLLLITNAQAKKQYYYLDKLSDYNLTVVIDNYIYTYSGNYSGLSLSFKGTEKKVKQISFMFQGNNETYVKQMIEVLEALVPDDFSATGSFSKKFLNTLNRLKKERDDEILRAEGMRFDVRLSNGMIHVDVATKWN